MASVSFGQPHCWCGALLSRMSPRMIEKWKLFRGERWRWHTDQQAYFNYCRDCHRELWPKDVRAQGPNCRHAASRPLHVRPHQARPHQTSPHPMRCSRPGPARPDQTKQDPSKPRQTGSSHARAHANHRARTSLDQASRIPVESLEHSC